MTLREFNKSLKKICDKKGVDINKISLLSYEERSGMVYFIVKHRLQVLKELIPAGFDLSWLRCMGYGYETKGKKYTFVHTCEQRIL